MTVDPRSLPQLNLVKCVEDFHEHFEIGYNGPPRVLPQEWANFRMAFMAEELLEYMNACNSGDIVKQFDALIDLIYVALGTAYLQGLPLEAGFLAVHLANMSKIKAKTASDSKRNFVHDIVKPPGWTSPEEALATFIKIKANVDKIVVVQCE